MKIMRFVSAALIVPLMAFVLRPGCNGAREIAKIRESERHEDRDRLLAEG